MTHPQPCGGDRVTERLRYFSGQLLQAEDLRDEQDYLLDRIRSHNRLHGYGTVCGLAVAPTDPPSGQVVVEPGVALDCCGREIVLEEEIELSVTDLVSKARRRGSVFVTLGYGEEEVDPTPAAATDGPEHVRASRIREVPVVGVIGHDPEAQERPAEDRTGIVPCHEWSNRELVIARIDVSSRKAITAGRIDNTVRRMISLDHDNRPSQAPRARSRWLKRGIVTAGAAMALVRARRLLRRPKP